MEPVRYRQERATGSNWRVIAGQLPQWDPPVIWQERWKSWPATRLARCSRNGARPLSTGAPASGHHAGRADAAAMEPAAYRRERSACPTPTGPRSSSRNGAHRLPAGAVESLASTGLAEQAAMEPAGYRRVRSAWRCLVYSGSIPPQWSPPDYLRERREPAVAGMIRQLPQWCPPVIGGSAWVQRASAAPVPVAAMEPVANRRERGS